jgi:hypothetical protein
MKYLLFFSAIFIMVSTACEKASRKDDFRDKYVGKYRVTEEIKSYGSPVCGSVFSVKDTIITVDYGTNDSTLVVLGREVKLDEDGYYHSYHYGLRLWNDSIWSSHMNGGLGCGVYETYTGKRISSKP